MKNSNPFLDIFILLIGLVLIGHDLLKDKVSSTSDLTVVNGTIRNYSFAANNGFKTHTYRYFIYLNEYLNSFQIRGDFADWFDRAGFEQGTKQGDTLQILIAKSDYAKIGSTEKVSIFGIDSKAKLFLNPANVVREYNSQTTLVFGLGFVSLGLILLYFDLKRRLKKKLENRIYGT